MFSLSPKRTVFSAQERISIPEFAVLRFQPIDKHHALQTTSEYKYVKVKSASGHKERRFIVYTTIIIKRKKYQGYIGLTNRSELTKQVLIGRRFLQKHDILVDVSKSKRTDDMSEGI
jgi:hypothetical protein